MSKTSTAGRDWFEEEDHPTSLPTRQGSVRDLLDAPHNDGASEISDGQDSMWNGESEPVEPLLPEEEAELKTKAFRAVVQDNCSNLLEVLDRVKSPKIWSKW